MHGSLFDNQLGIVQNNLHRKSSCATERATLCFYFARRFFFFLAILIPFLDLLQHCILNIKCASCSNRHGFPYYVAS